jgi:hypothetical protein
MGWWVVFMGTKKANPTITTINSQAGINFDEMGQLLLYTTQWKIISYADLKPIQLLWKQVKEHQLKISESCNRIKKRPGTILQIVMLFLHILDQK